MKKLLIVLIKFTITKKEREMRTKIKNSEI